MEDIPETAAGLIQREIELRDRIFEDSEREEPALLTEDEIKNIKAKAVTIDVHQKEIKPVNPTLVSNGYKVSMSIVVLRDYLDIHHVSVLNPKGITDPAEAECIAKDILGEEYQFIAHGELEPNNLHFMKAVIKRGKKP